MKALSTVVLESGVHVYIRPIFGIPDTIRSSCFCGYTSLNECDRERFSRTVIYVLRSLLQH